MNYTFDATDLVRVARNVGASDRRLRAAAATALTRVQVKVAAAERAEIRDVFDRPTPYTENSIFVKPATAGSGVALMGIKDDTAGARPAVSWLRWQIRGGLRTLTAFEKALVRGGAMDGGDRAVPGRFARLDQFGNVSRGQLVQILSQLRIGTGLAGSVRVLPTLGAEDGKAEARRKAGVIRRAYQRAGGQFVAFPYGRGRLRAGIYQIRQFANGRADPKPVLIFVSKAEYEAGRFDFFDVAERVIRRELPVELGGELARAALNAQATAGTRWVRA